MGVYSAVLYLPKEGLPTELDLLANKLSLNDICKWKGKCMLQFLICHVN